MLDLLLRNATVIDGTGNPGYRASVGIKDGKIAVITRGSDLPGALKVIDCEGLVCAPGFIDVHTHTEYSILVHHHAVSTLHAGVTTEVMGMCGYGIFPVNDAIATEARARMAGMSQVDQAAVGEVDWTDLAGWLGKLDKNGVGINVIQFAGHGGIRAYVMGKEGNGGERVIPTAEELDAMKRAVAQCMEQGAFGLSSGLQYAPGRNAVTSELIELGKVVGRYGGAYISHMRSEDEYLNFAARELIEICRKTGMRGSMTHHKAYGIENWGKVHATTALIDDARSEGVQVMCDFYPWEYAAESNIGSTFYTDFEQTPRDAGELMERLKNEATWAELKAHLLEMRRREAEAMLARSVALAEHGVKSSATSNHLDTSYIVHSRTHPEVVGLSERDAARVMGFGGDFLEAARRLYLDDDGYCYYAGGLIGEDDIRHLVKYPHAAISTDSWTWEKAPDLRRPGMSAHPRAYGSFAKTLGLYSRDLGLVRLEEAVRKMTSLPASLLGLDDRGVVRPGLWADLTIFDPARVANQATFSDPYRFPAGIEYVLVNGMLAIDRGMETRTLSGKVLRRPCEGGGT
ncbi:MAG: amidohydrolase family protein [Bacillota bacterium]|nr:amidohydrolase family protein [Bacillota bacterium]